MGDLTSPRAIWAKGVLFVFLGVLASMLLLLIARDLRVAALLGVAVWSFCRAYYFAFYVIEHYVDPEYRFAGLIDFAKYALRRPGASGPPSCEPIEPVRCDEEDGR